MSEKNVRIAIDCMGGDNAPYAILDGVKLALDDDKNITVTLVGDEKILKDYLQNNLWNHRERINILPSEDDILMNDHPVQSIMKKKKSSIVLAARAVSKGEADCFVSCGNTGAVLAAGHIFIKPIKGIDRPALAILLPTLKDEICLLDCGANVDAKPNNLLQFAFMASIYMEKLKGKKPTVGLVNIGSEREKGNALVQDTFPLMEQCKDIDFVGSLEARDIPNGDVDIAVCEAFVGNVVLKSMEGMLKTMLKVMKEAMMENLATKLSALVLKPSLKKHLGSFDLTKYGGAPMLGLNSLVIKGHGNSDSIATKNAIIQGARLDRLNIIQTIKDGIDTHNKLSGGEDAGE